MPWRNITNYLTGLQKTANDKFPLGKDLYAQMLKDTEQVDLPIEQIEAAGRADLERNTAALKTECATYLPKGTLAACVAKMSANKPPEGDLEAARKQLAMLRDFVQKNNVVTIPNNDEVLVVEAPPYNRANFAFIQVPGPYDKGVAATYNIAPPNPKWTKAEQAAYIASEATLMSTSVHEVWPGHFLQFLHSNANPDKLEGLWVGYAFAEGWAHYCRGDDVRGGPEQGRSGDAHRSAHGRAAARCAAAVLHRPAHGGLDRGAIREDVQGTGLPGSGQCASAGRARHLRSGVPQLHARQTDDPEAADRLGRQDARRRRRSACDRRLGHNGGTAPAGAGSAPAAGEAPVAAGSAPAADQALWHDFHDKFLSYGGPPIPLLRKEMVGGEGTLL